MFVNRNEPLLGGAEDHRFFTAPTMRIRVFDELQLEQCSVLLHSFRNELIGLVVMFPGNKFRHGTIKIAAVIHRHNDGQFVF